MPEEYLEYLRQNTTALERLGDRFTTVDQRVDYVVKQLDSLLAGGVPAEVRASIENLRAEIDKLTQTAELLTSALREQKAMIGETTQKRIQETLAGLTGGRFSVECPWDAVITSICFHFPPGCSALVDVAAGHSGKQIFPYDGFIALDSATPVFTVNEVVDRNELLWADIRNGDAVNPHTISVIFTLQRRL